MKGREAEEGLTRKGFEMVRKKGDSHKYFYFLYPTNEKNLRISTMIQDHGDNKDIKPGDLSKMKRQLKLHSSKDLSDLVKCPKSKEQYILELKMDGYLK